MSEGRITWVNQEGESEQEGESVNFRSQDVELVLILQRQGHGPVSILEDRDVGSAAIFQDSQPEPIANQCQDDVLSWEWLFPSVFVQPLAIWPSLPITICNIMHSNTVPHIATTLLAKSPPIHKRATF